MSDREQSPDGCPGPDERPRSEDASGPDEEYPLAPDDPSPPLGPTLPPGCDPDRLLNQTPSNDADNYQFTLSELLLLVAGVSVFLSAAATVLKCFPKGATPDNFAGMMSFAAIACWMAMILLAPKRRIVIVGWWVLLGLYFLTCVVAAVSK